MAISYVGGVASGRAGSVLTTSQSLTGLTGGIASAPAEGDFVVVHVSVGTANTYQPTTLAISGYSSETMISNTAVTYQSFSQVSYKLQTATPDTSITIPSSGNARNAQRWEVHVFRGVDSSAPAAFATANGSATGRPNPAAITPSAAGSWIMATYASAALVGTEFTAPTDFATAWLGGKISDTYDATSGSGYYTGWTSGSYDPAAITAGGTTGATDSWTAYTIAIKPGPGSGPVNVNVTGVAGTGAVGTATVAAKASATLTGVQGTAVVGSETVTAKANTTLTGVSGTGVVGTVTVDALTPVNVDVTGVQGVGAVGDATVAAKATMTLTGIAGIGAVGTATVAAKASATLTGVQGTAVVGDVTVVVVSAVTVYLTGVYGTATCGTVLVWGQIDDDQTPGWVTIDGSQTPGWTPVSANQTPGWGQIDTSQTPGWDPIIDSQSPNWQQVAA